MVANIIDGKALANNTLEEIRQLILKQNLQPGLAVILIGDDPASSIYVKRKQEACQKVGIHSLPHYLAETTTEKELIDLIEHLNNDANIHGILVQLPLPAHINVQAVLEAIAPNKDVDGFHPYNLGRLAQKKPLLQPCTPLGVMKLLQHINIKPRGKHAVIVGASNIVGRPMALELLLAGSTITICHQSTQDLSYHVKQADILVSAVGIPELIKGEWIKPGCVVIDVGINRLANGKLCGDVQFEQAKEKAAWITPVPGGVGPMTVAMLMHNTLQACLSTKIKA